MARQLGIGAGNLGLGILAQHVEGADGAHGFGPAVSVIAQRQVEATAPELSQFIGVGLRGCNSFGIDLYSKHAKLRI